MSPSTETELQSPKVADKFHVPSANVASFQPHKQQSTPQTYPQIRAIQLQIRTRWSRPTTIPGTVLANVLRGALGITLRKLVCPEDWMNHACPPCPLYRECAYGQVFTPSPPDDAQQLRLQQDLPRPFVIEPPGLHPDERVTSEGLNFKLMLFGSAIDSLPFMISTLDRLGSDGLGRDRVPFSIERITTCHPTEEETLFKAGSNSVTLPKRVITTDDLLSVPWPTESTLARSASEGSFQTIARRASEESSRSLARSASEGSFQTIARRASEGSCAIPSATHDVRRRILARMGVEQPTPVPATDPDKPRLKLRFLTPLLLKSGSGINENGTRIPAQEIRERPPFGVIIRRLRDRLSALCAFFGEPWACPDFSGLGTMADQVTIVSSQTTWLTRNRQSTRTGQSHEISGLVGQTTYEFPDEPTFEVLSPLLKFVELIHVGKNAPWGNGGIQSHKIR